MQRYTAMITGGKTHLLRLSYNALAEYNDRVGHMNEDLRERPFKATRGIVWACINAQGAEAVTLDQAGDICETFIQENGSKALVDFVQSIIDTCPWLGGPPKETDKGNAEPGVSPPGT